MFYVFLLHAVDKPEHTAQDQESSSLQRANASREVIMEAVPILFSSKFRKRFNVA
jgi:hypothetical protein